MSQTLTEIAQQLKAADKKVQLIYAFNGVGKTRLSREFKRLIAPKNDIDEGEAAGAATDDDAGANEAAGADESSRTKILYYNAFTEDLFYWDNDLELDADPRLKIQPNSFTDWVLEERGQDQNIISNFQRYTNDKLTPRFNQEYKVKDKDDEEITVKAFSEVTFSLERGDDVHSGNLKISKGEESNFIWSIFYTLIQEIIEILNEVKPDYPEPTPFDSLEYVFVDDPVSSLDENHLIQLAVDLAQLVKSNESTVKFVITTHNPLFYNVLYNEFSRDDKGFNYKKGVFQKYRLGSNEDGTYQLVIQASDSPFSYHLHLLAELESAVSTGQLHKYHFNFIRNILEKTSTFLGHTNWGDLLPKNEDGKTDPYESRIINISSHSKHAGEEVTALTEEDKRVLGYLVAQIKDMYGFKSRAV